MTSPGELYDRLGGENAPLLLDVRNQDEFARWKIESAGPVEFLNIPYFEFIENEQASVSTVEKWRSRREGRDLVVVCAKGGSSQFVADMLRERGVAAANLEGGMAAWGSATVCRPIAAGPVQVWQVLRFGKGCISYILAAGGDAIIVDPHRRVDDLRGLLRDRGLTLRGVFDTHLHADHISGGRALSGTQGVPYYGNSVDFEGGAFAIEPLEDRAVIRLGGIEVTPLIFMHAPGHTPGSTVLLANDALLMTGDTLFVESVGRPDLAGKAAEWGGDLYRTLHVRLAKVHDDVLVLPAHTSGPNEARPDGTVGGTLGALRRKNASLQLDEGSFLREVEENLAPAPEHYARIRELNLGIAAVSEDERSEMELGKNECAAARKPARG